MIRGGGSAWVDTGAVPSAASFANRWAALAAAGAGLSGYLAFPTWNWWPLAFVSVAGLSAAVDGRRKRTAAGLGYGYGLAFLLPLLSWTGVYVGPVPWVILCVGFAPFYALLGVVLSLVQRLRAAPLWIGAAWVLQEALRDRLPFGGFPWGRLAFSQADSPVRWFAPLGGMPLVTFAVAVAGGALFLAGRAAARGRNRGAVIALAGATAVLLLGLAMALPLGPGAAPKSVRIALIQGGLKDHGLGFESRVREVLDVHVAQTLKLAAAVVDGTQPQPDLVLWPENSSDVDPLSDAYARAAVTRAVRAIKAPILIGAIQYTQDGRHRLNVGIMWSPASGPGERYVKRHPVPFGEYIPLRGLAEWVSKDAKLVATDMIGGSGDGVVTGGPVPIGDVICFEVAYDGLVQSSVDAGAQLVVVQTNNATFGHTDETYQQLAMSRLRAVETGRTVLQVSTTGESAIIDPDGHPVADSGRLFEPAILTAAIAPRTGITLSVRLGMIPELFLAGAALTGVGLSVAVTRRRRTIPFEPEAEDSRAEVLR